MFKLRVTTGKKQAPAVVPNKVEPTPEVELSPVAAAILRKAVIDVAQQKAVDEFEALLDGREIVSWVDGEATRFGLRSKAKAASSVVELLNSSEDDVDPDLTYALNGFRLTGKTQILAYDALTPLTLEQFATKAKHDVSGEARDSNGRWTSGGNKPKDKEDKPKEKPKASPFQQHRQRAEKATQDILSALDQYEDYDPETDGDNPEADRRSLLKLTRRVADLLNKQNGDNWDIPSISPKDDYDTSLANMRDMIEQLDEMLSSASNYDPEKNGDTPEKDLSEMKLTATELSDIFDDMCEGTPYGQEDLGDDDTEDDDDEPDYMGAAREAVEDLTLEGSIDADSSFEEIVDALTNEDIDKDIAEAIATEMGREPKPKKPIAKKEPKRKDKATATPNTKASSNEQVKIARKLRNLLEQLSESIRDVDVDSAEFATATATLKQIHSEFCPERKIYSYDIPTSPSLTGETAEYKVIEEPNAIGYLSALNSASYIYVEAAYHGNLKAEHLTRVNSVIAALSKLC